MTIYTIGHSTRSIEEFLGLLEGAEVKLLADVRAFPGSRRHPQFNRDALSSSMAEAGIQYAHMRGLGGRRTPIGGSRNAGWREAAFQGYADHMASEEFRRSLAELEAAAGRSRTAIMCAEALWWRCHRRLIADALLVRGWRIEHLGLGEAPVVHGLPQFAVIDHSGEITYPPPQATLPEP